MLGALWTHTSCLVKIQHTNNRILGSDGFKRAVVQIYPQKEEPVLTCTYDPGSSPQIPSPPPLLSSLLTPYPVSECRPVFSIFVLLFRRHVTAQDGWTAAAARKTTNEITKKKNEPTRKATIQQPGIILSARLKAQRRKEPGVKRGDQASSSPSSTTNSSPAWRTVAKPSAITTKASEKIDSRRRGAIWISLRTQKGKREGGETELMNDGYEIIIKKNPTKQKLKFRKREWAFGVASINQRASEAVSCLLW